MHSAPQTGREWPRLWRARRPTAFVGRTGLAILLAVALGLGPIIGGAEPDTDGPPDEASKGDAEAEGADDAETAKEDDRRPGDVELRTVYDDRRAGAEITREVEQQLGYVDAPALLAYVQRIGKRLARHAPGRFDYHFQIVDQDEPNAFALPGGYIFVSRGLLILTNTEDELANVLGHEIVHVAQRHAAARQGITRGFGGILAWLSPASLASYGRGQEAEADRIGQGMAAQAGYDPAGMAAFMRALDFSERLERGASRLPSFYDTHPTTVRRSAVNADRAARLEWTRGEGIAADRSEYLPRIDGLHIGSSAAEGVFERDRFLHPELGFMMRFPEGWELHNTKTAVGAISQRLKAQVYLEHHGSGDDPRKAADEYMRDQASKGLRVERGEPVRLGANRAYRLHGHAPGGSQVVVTFIAYKGSIFRLIGFAAGRVSSDLDGVFVSVARSFRPLPPVLEGRIYEVRLRVVEAQEGETLQGLSRRVGNVWDIQTTAVMNGLFTDGTLSEGTLIKVARREAYQPVASSDDRSRAGDG